MRRAIVLLAAMLVVAGTGGAPEAPAVETAGWCGLYCDIIYAGCRKTIGLISESACVDWHIGCLDGCRVKG